MSILLYGGETWPMTVASMKRLEAAYQNGKEKYWELCGETKSEMWKSEEGQAWVNWRISLEKGRCNGRGRFIAWSREGSQSKHPVGVRLVDGREDD
jgi:hypothetical protein